MKMKGKALLSLLIVLTLVLQFFPASAFAAGSADGWESLVYAAYLQDEFGQLQPVSAEEDYLLENPYSISVGGWVLDRSPSGVQISELMNSELLISPPAGFYVAQAWIYGDDTGSRQPLPLTASPSSADVMLSCDAAVARYDYGSPVFNNDLLSSGSSSGTFTVGVAFARINSSAGAAITYNDGGYAGEGYAQTNGAPYEDPNAAFAGWMLRYNDNGASVLVPAYSGVSAYAPCTLSPVYVPRIILKPADMTVSEGMDSYEAQGLLQPEIQNLPGDLSFEYISMSVDAYGSLAAGSYTLRVDGYSLVDAYTGKPVDGSRAVVELRDGLLTVEGSAPAPAPVPADPIYGTVTVYDQSWTLDGNYHNLDFNLYSVDGIPADAITVSVYAADANGAPIEPSTAPAGTYTITAFLDYDTSLYSVGLQNATLTISEQQMSYGTVTLYDQSWTLDGNYHNLDFNLYSVDGIPADAISVSVYAADANGSPIDPSTAPANTYTITAYLDYDSSRYSVSLQNAALTISEAAKTPGTVTFYNQSWALDGTEHDLNYDLYTVDGIPADAISVSLYAADAAGVPIQPSTAPIGTYTITGYLSYDESLYTVTVNNATLSIESPQLTFGSITFYNQSWVLDGNYHNLDFDFYTVEGIPSDAISVSLYAADAAGVPIEPSTAPAGTYTITGYLSYNESLYSVTVNNATLTIENPQLTQGTVTFQNQSWVLDGNYHNLDFDLYTVEGIPADAISVSLYAADAAGAPIEPSTAPAGTYTITGYLSYNESLYSVTVNTATLTIENAPRADLVVQVLDQSWKGDYTPHAIDETFYTIDGLTGSAAIPVSLSVYTSDGHDLGIYVTEPGTYRIVATVGEYDTEKYSVSVANEGTLTVSAPDPIPVTVTVNDQSWTADGSAHALDAFAYSVTGMIDGDTLPVTLSLRSSSGEDLGSEVTNPGEYRIVASVGSYDTAKYTVTVEGEGKLVVNAPEIRSVVVTVHDQALTYNGSAQTINPLGYSIDGLMGGDTLSVSLSAIDQNGQAVAAVTNAGTYVIQASVGAYDTNRYNVTIANTGKLTVAPFAVTVTPNPATKTYDGQPLVSNAVTAALLPLHQFRANDGVTTAAFDLNGVRLVGGPVAVGTYVNKITGVHIVDAGGNEVTSNYSLQFVDGTLTITAAPVTVKPVTVTVLDQTWTYDGAAHYLDGNMFTVAGLGAGESITVTLVAVDMNNQPLGTSPLPGTYRITATVQADTKKYDVTVVPGRLTVTSPVSYTLAETGAAKTWTKGSTEGLSFRINGDITKFANRVDVDNTQLAATFYSVSAGSTVITLSPAYLQTLSEGMHGIRVYFTDGSFNSTFTVLSPVAATPIPLTITGRNVGKAYDGLPYDMSTYGANSQGVIAVFHLAQNGIPVQQAINAGSYDIYLDSVSFANPAAQGYRVTVIDAYGVTISNDYKNTSVKIGTLSITGGATIPLTITVRDQTIPYDGTAHTLTANSAAYTVDGLQSGDNLTVRLSILDQSGRALSSVTDVGTYSIKAEYSGLTPGKYSVTIANQGRLTVTPYKLTLTAVSASKTYDGSANFDKKSSVSATALLPGHSFRSGDGVRFSIYDSRGNLIKSGPVDVGTYTKKVTEVHIIDSTGREVTSNYDITRIDGTLTIVQGSGSPRTGDNNNLVLWLVLLIASAVLVAVIAAWLILRRKKAGRKPSRGADNNSAKPRRK